MKRKLTPRSIGLRFGLTLAVFITYGCDSALTPPEPVADAPAAQSQDGPLKITGVSPSVGTVEGNTVALIRGTGFAPGVKVLFGGAEAKQVQVVSDAMLTAQVPEHSPDTVDVVVQGSIEGEMREAALGAAFTFAPVTSDDGLDGDGDGRTNTSERVVGYQIQVDFFGFGLSPEHVVRYTVTSDPMNPDADNDGLSDDEEFAYKTDPNNNDTDLDGLWDGEEINRWDTSPVSVDSDGDARGPDPSNSGSTLPPVASQFDGLELFAPGQLAGQPGERGPVKPGATSPSLDDTDGDGVRDLDDQDSRSPLLADMPQLDFKIVDEVDIRLDVEYAEEEGTTTSYETSLTTGQETTNSRSNTVSASVTVSTEIGTGPLSFGSTSVEVSSGWENSWSTDSTTSSEQSTTQGQEKSRTHTETASTGSLSAGVEIKNVGKISVKVANLAYTVRQWVPNTDSNAGNTSPGEYRTLATLLPEIGDGLTLAPGDSSGVIQASGTEVNADRVKEFMARPDSLHIIPSAFEFENAEGINFAFIEEVTRAQTARVSIDYGDGRFEEFRVATNVDRNFAGDFTGIKMSDVMDLTVGPGNWEVGGIAVPCLSSPVVLTRVRDVTASGGASPRFWSVFADSFQDVSFPNYVLHAGTGILIALSQDTDGDGLFAAQEQQYGSSDGAADTDGDGISDPAEAAREYRDLATCQVVEGGWTVTVTRSDATTYSYRVYPDPRRQDTDGDGLTDAQEKNLVAGSTDPTKVDTDGDGLWDNVDPYPRFQAVTLYVKSGGGTAGGTSWGTAFGTLQAAITAANTRNTNATGADDAAEIWVAAGTYTPAAGQSYGLPAKVTIYGGFEGTETKVGQRNPDPLTNGAILRASSASLPIFLASSVLNTTLDGFTLDQSTARAMKLTSCTATIRNCFFFNNSTANVSSDKTGGAVWLSGGTVTFADCTFSNNSSTGSGLAVAWGGAMVVSNGTLTLDHCLFFGNRANHILASGGALYAGSSSTVTIDGCSFEANTVGTSSTTTALIHGGAVALVDGRARVYNTVFRGNLSLDAPAASSPWSSARAGGGASVEGACKADFVNCEFYGNQAKLFGGGLYVASGATGRLVNCSFSENQAVPDGTDWRNCGSCSVGIGTAAAKAKPFAVGAAVGVLGTVKADNCIFYNNIGMDIELNHAFCHPTKTPHFGPALQVSTLPAFSGMPCITAAGTLIYNYCNVQGESQTGRFAGMQGGLGNFDANPLFVGGRSEPDDPATAGGNLRLSSESPCVDRGNRLVDIDLVTAGFQLLPAADLDGDARIADGDLDGDAQVDIGAYESQGSSGASASASGNGGTP